MKLAEIETSESAEGLIRLGRLRRTTGMSIIAQYPPRLSPTLLVTVQRRDLWVVTPSQKYPANFAPKQSI